MEPYGKHTRQLEAFLVGDVYTKPLETHRRLDSSFFCHASALLIYAHCMQMAECPEPGTPVRLTSLERAYIFLFRSHLLCVFASGVARNSQ